MYTTRQDVIAHIAAAIEANGADIAASDQFALDAIADAAFEYSPELGAFVQTVDTEGFWAAVQWAAL